MKGKKPSMSRNDAKAMYADLKKAMSGYGGNMGKPGPASAAARQPKPGSKSSSSNAETAKIIAQSLKAAMAADDAQAAAAPREYRGGVAVPGAVRLDRGHYTAITMVLLAAAFKVTLSVLEATGVSTALNASASLAGPGAAPLSSLRSAAMVNTGAAGFSREEMRVLTALDARRVDLEKRSQRLDQREADLEKRDAEFASKLTQIRELTEQLKVDREKNEKRKSGQLDQLANVYGSMDPREAAALIEQLDVTIALELIQRMPEKRIGQILALMSPDRALSITRMLSGAAVRQ